MFDKIQNPATGKWVNTNGPVGRKVLNNYVRQAGGGDEEARMQGALGAVRKYWLDGENDYTYRHADLQVKLGIAENAVATAAKVGTAVVEDKEVGSNCIELPPGAKVVASSDLCAAKKAGAS